MLELLFDIGLAVVFMNIALLFACIVWCDDKSSLIGIASLCTANFLMQIWGEYLKSFFGHGGEWLKHTWYLSFPIVHLITVAVIYFLHTKYKVTPNWISKFVSFSFVVICSVTISRYISYIILDKDVLIIAVLYKNLIPSINICVPLVIFANMYLKNKKPKIT